MSLQDVFVFFMLILLALTFLLAIFVIFYSLREIFYITVQGLEIILVLALDWILMIAAISEIVIFLIFTSIRWIAFKDGIHIIIGLSIILQISSVLMLYLYGLTQPK